MQDVIDKIRSAEKSGDEIRGQAEKEAEAMLSQEKVNGRKHIDETVAAAGKRAGDIIEQAEKKA